MKDSSSDNTVATIKRRNNIFIYIVESPKPEDIYDGISEGGILQQSLKLKNIQCSYRIVINKELFKQAILKDMVIEIGKQPSSILILHISCHGNKTGIQLNSGEEITWNELGEILSSSCEFTKKPVILCMSSCEGFAGLQMAFRLDNKWPFFAIIGNKNKPIWDETLIGYLTFYHQIHFGTNVIKAVDNMKIASLNKDFDVITKDEAQKIFQEALKKALPKAEIVNK